MFKSPFSRRLDVRDLREKGKRAMPGRNCCIPQCFSSDDAFYKEAGVRFMTIPTLKRDDYVAWKDEIVKILEKYRVLHREDYERIENGRMYVCTRHVLDKDVYATGKLFFKLAYIYLPASAIRYSRNLRRISPIR